MPNILTNVLAFAFALGIIIFVHEWGHLMMAKAFNVKVLKFSLGFGKSLWSFQRGETEYRLSALPLGGYVQLAGENPEDLSDDPREFLRKPRWQRILVYLAGPLMNVILAILIFAGLFMVGIEVLNLPAIPARIGAIEPKSSAEAAGLQRGDQIVRVNGEPSPSWQEVGFALLTSPDKPVRLTVERGGKSFDATVTPRRDPKYEVGDSAGIFPSIRPLITSILPDGPAAAAGFQVGDEIRAVDNRPVFDSKDFVGFVNERPGQRIDVQVVRNDGKTTSIVSVTPRNEGGVGRIGVGIGFYQRYGPGRAFVESVRYNVQIVRETFKVISKIFSRQISAKGALAGPIEIAAQSGAAARTGFKYLLHLMGFISISIAILNLMPIPILDGGQIFILAIEGVMRRDLPMKVKEAISQVGFVMILLLMVTVLWFDLAKNLPKGLLPGS